MIYWFVREKYDFNSNRVNEWLYSVFFPYEFSTVVGRRKNVRLRWFKINSVNDAKRYRGSDDIVQLIWMSIGSRKMNIRE